MTTAVFAKSVFTPSIIFRLALGWASYLSLVLLGPNLPEPISGPLLFLLLGAIIVVIALCSFGVVTQAEHLAKRLGDPYGTLVLTISIALIEVILISAVMLGPGEHATIARDSVMAVSMIIMNLVIGVALLVSPRSSTPLRANRKGLLTYLALLTVLSVIAFALPNMIGTDRQYQPAQQVVIIVLTVIVYATFLYYQMKPGKRSFQEVDLAVPRKEKTKDAADSSAVATLRQVVVLRTLVLVLLMIPVVLLSHDMAVFLDDGLGRLGAPVALSGLLIAMIVFLPETITTFRAARGGEMQRVSNLCHGALLSTMGLTIPAVLTIGLLTGQPVVLGENTANLIILALTYAVTVVSFGLGKTRTVPGFIHLVLFGVFAGAMFL